jgi:hypothetical protein
MTVRTRRDDTDIVRVFDCCDYTGSEDEFLPGFTDIQDVNTYKDTSSDNKTKRRERNRTNRLASSSTHKAPSVYRNFLCQYGTELPGAAESPRL